MEEIDNDVVRLKSEEESGGKNLSASVESSKKVTLLWAYTIAAVFVVFIISLAGGESPETASAPISDDRLGAILGFALSALLLISVATFIVHKRGLGTDSVAKPWVQNGSLAFGLISVFLFEFSLFPLLAVSFGLVTILNSGSMWKGVLGVSLGVIYVIVNGAVNLGLA